VIFATAWGNQSIGLLSRYVLSVSDSPVAFDHDVADHQVIIRGGQVEAVVVPLEEYRAEGAGAARGRAVLGGSRGKVPVPSRLGDHVPDGKVNDSMDALLGLTSTPAASRLIPGCPARPNWRSSTAWPGSPCAARSPGCATVARSSQYTAAAPTSSRIPKDHL
jgi:hypothetical protein